MAIGDPWRTGAPLLDYESAMLRQTHDTINAIFHLYDPPLWLVTARAQAARGGCIATSVTRASIVNELPRVLIAIAKHHHTWRLIEASGLFALHLLAEDDLDAVWRFGLASGHHTEKFTDLESATTQNLSPHYTRACAWMDCRVEARLDIGDRTTYLAEITGGALIRRVPVLSVAGLLRQAPPDRHAELKRLYARDQNTDRAAILAWREDFRD